MRLAATVREQVLRQVGVDGLVAEEVDREAVEADQARDGEDEQGRDEEHPVRPSGPGRRSFAGVGATGRGCEERSG
ncbi:hypothetical protein DCC79_12675 [bacterium]|nr:MAG: hypothetical protein DCC79_12675 [bacterium]